MTSHVVRLYAAAGALLVLFLTWAAIAAHPWTARKAVPTPALAALVAREQRVSRESAAVKRVVAQRWAAYRAELARRSALASAPAPAAAPSVRVVTLPPLTITRTS